jgi:triosephosphate isomerase (TIM)
MRTAIIAGNWKMNTSLDEARALASAIKEKSSGFDAVQRVLIPPFPWIIPVSKIVAGSDITVGAQNCYSEMSGAFTGEVSPEMLAPHCSHVVLGHSERRHILGETDAQVAAKVNAAIRAGVGVILCVGETLEERESESAQDVVSRQLDSALKSHSAEDMANVVIAYEPVWAIGTGRAASADDAQEMARFVRDRLADRFGGELASTIRIQYGGSVKSDNAPELMACTDVDGALVGGASLDADEFCGIIEAAAQQVN